MPDSDKVTSLGEFVCRVGEIREDWRVDAHKELWFRGEGQKHEKSLLRPQLYRPPNGRAMKSVPELLKIENDLYEYFQRCGVRLCDQKPGEAEWDWDWYFLDPGTDEWLRTCTIITGEPNEFVREIHTRMPVILPEEHHEAWLTGEAGKEILVPFPVVVAYGSGMAPFQGNLDRPQRWRTSRFIYLVEKGP